MNRLLLSALVSLSTLVSMNQALASTETFTESGFNEAARSDKPFLVAFHSDSCGSCKVQKPNLQEALNEASLKGVRGLMADFDATSEFRKGLEKPVGKPSTIVIFKGNKEIARIFGETKKDKLVALVSKRITQ